MISANITFLSRSFLVVMFVLCTGPSDAWRDEYKRDIASLRALISKPTVISTTTLREVGGQANKKSKVVISLPPTDAFDLGAQFGHESPTLASSC